ncbi:MAG: uroporphyrinogen-III synthase [Pseudomonadota bacterium]
MTSTRAPHLVITRPVEQARETQTYFAQHHIDSTVLPVLAIESILDQASVDACLAGLNDCRHVIFISANAAHAGMKQLNAAGLSCANNTIMWAIGEATAKALTGYGVSARVAQGSYNSEALLSDSLLHNVAEQRVLIFRGEGGRQHLAQVLRERGAVVDYCEVYRRVATSPEPGGLRTLIEQQQSLALLLMSVESVDAFERYAINEGVLDTCKALPVLAPGPRIQGALTSRGYQRIVAAERANLDCLCTALKQLIT